MNRPSLLLLAVILCAAMQPSAASVQAFAQLPLIDSPELSPDGTKVAALISSQGTQLLAMSTVAQWKPVAVRLRDDESLQRWEWVNDEWLIISISAVRSVNARSLRVSRAYGVRASDAKVVDLSRPTDGQNASRILWIARDGTPRVLLAIQQSLYDEVAFYPEVFEVDVSTGKRVSRMRPREGVMDWYADGDGVVRMGVGYRDLNRKSQLLYRRTASDILRVIDSAKERDGETLMPVPAVFLAEPGKALAYSDHSGFESLHELDLETMTLGKSVFSVPGYDIGSLVTDHAGTRLLGVRYTDTQPRTHWVDADMARAQRALDAALGPDRRARILSISRDQQKMILVADSGSDPGGYFHYDVAQKTVHEIARLRPALKDAPPATVQTLRYAARDGLMLEAVLTLPVGSAERNLPLIVMPHGGPFSRNAEYFDWWAQFIAHLGYAVLQPNYRGSSGYGKAFELRGDGEWGLAMQDDLLDGIAHLAGNGIADPARVCIVGASYGGYAALRAAQRDAGRIRCAVSFAGISDLTEMVRYDERYLNSGRRRDRQLRRSPDLEAVSPLRAVAEFGAPVLLLHGLKDLTVPARQSSQLASRLQEAGKVVRYVELPQGDHTLSRQQDRVTVLTEIERFLAEHNPVR